MNDTRRGVTHEPVARGFLGRYCSPITRGWRGTILALTVVIAVPSDPGPTERIAGRTLVGDAGQRVLGFLSKLGLTRSYFA